MNFQQGVRCQTIKKNIIYFVFLLSLSQDCWFVVISVQNYQRLFSWHQCWWFRSIWIYFSCVACGLHEAQQPVVAGLSHGMSFTKWLLWGSERWTTLKIIRWKDLEIVFWILANIDLGGLFRCGGAKHIGKSKVFKTNGYFWKLRYWKSARRCGAKHISKSKC